MNLREMLKKGALAALGLALLGMLWGRVRAAQGMGPVTAGGWAGLKTRVEGGALRLSRRAQFQGIMMEERTAVAAPAADAMFFAGGNYESQVRTPVPSSVPKKIVRNANATFEVKNHAEARARALELARRYGAEIQQDETYENGGCKSGVLAFRVAPDKLDALLRELEPLGRILHRSVSTENMTEEYVDLQARLDNLHKVEKRLTELLSFKTHKLPDVLQVEHELERVGAEIERLVGRMKYIDSLAAQSVLTLNLHEPSRETSAAPGVLTRIGNSIMRAFNTFITTGLTLLDITGFLLAVGLWVAPFVIGYAIIQRCRRKPDA